MRSSRLLWLVLAGMCLSAWNLPSIAGFRHTGLLWLAISAALLVPLFRTPLVLGSARMYSCFLAYAAVSLTWLDDGLRRGNVQDIIQLAAPMMIFLVARDIRDDPRSDGREVPIPLTGLALAAGLIMAPLFLEIGTGMKLTSLRPAAISMSFVAAGFLSHAATGDSRGWVGAGVAVVFCFLSGSRTAAFAILAMAGVVPLRQRTWGPRIGVLVAVGVAALLLFKSARFQERFFHEHGGSGTLQDIAEGRFDTTGRAVMWPVFWEEVRRHPLLGHGAGASHRLAYETAWLAHPHNDYLKILYEYGIVGSVLFWSLFVRAGLRAAREVYGRNRGRRFGTSTLALLMLVSFMLIAITDNPILYTAHCMFPLYYILGLYVNSPSLVDEERTQDIGAGNGLDRDPVGTSHAGPARARST